jgi:hypothetical protein
MQLGNPIIPPVDIRKFDRFGKRDLNYDGDFLDPGENHQGVDLRPKSDNILASHDGKVTFVGKDQYGGLYIDVTNGNYKTRYLHNRQNLVKIGQTVKQGQLIGYIGSTGNSSGRHLHFEVWLDGKRINPESVITFNPNTNPEMTNQKILDAINSATHFDAETKRLLTASVHNDDGAYLVAFAGNEPRGLLIQANQQIETLKVELEEAKKVTDVRIVENNVPTQNLTVQTGTPQKWDWIANEKWGVYTGSAMALISSALAVLVENSPELAKVLEGENIATGGSLTGIALIIFRSIYQISKKNKENAKTS